MDQLVCRADSLDVCCMRTTVACPRIVRNGGFSRLRPLSACSSNDFGVGGLIVNGRYTCAIGHSGHSHIPDRMAKSLRAQRGRSQESVHHESVRPSISRLKDDCHSFDYSSTRFISISL